ncbi:MAG: hypothetical protein CM15mP73_0160 [Hyphomicrobiales bacterium]|nr:MAG: hypothetical protein CM15mP73_0160 [Hyphomicrobiales bacterium]
MVLRILRIRPLPGVEWTVNVDREKAGIYNTDVATIGSVIRLVTKGSWLATLGQMIPRGQN